MVSVSHKRSLCRLTLFMGLCVGISLPAVARITCCDIDGKRVCGDPPPPQCLTKAKTIFGKGGVAKEVEAPLTAEQRVARQAAAARQAEEEKKAIEQARRDRALLDSYSNSQEIDLARDRAVAEIEKNAEQARNRLETALKRQQKLEQEQEFYRNKPVPAGLQAQVRDNASEISAQEKALQEKDDGIAAIKARFEADKARYQQISGGQVDRK
jgi:hypothetical protein